MSFDPFRTLGLSGVSLCKPEHYRQQEAALKAADWVLFPEHWQINALVFGWGCNIFPSLPSYLIGHDKVEMTRAFEAVAPAHTPFTLIRANTDAGAEQIWSAMTLPFVVKRPKASMGEGVWLVKNRDDFERYRALTDRLYAQQYLPIERDARVVIVGRQVVCAYWRSQSPEGFYNNVARGGIIDHSPVPFDVVNLALEVAQTLGVDYAGFDIALVDGHPYLLEFNRLFGHRGIPGGTLALGQALKAHLQAVGEHVPGDTGEA